MFAPGMTGATGGVEPLGPALGLADTRTGGHPGLKPGSGNRPLYRNRQLHSTLEECPLLSAPGGGLHVFLEGEVVVGEVGIEVEFAEVYFFVIGGGVVRGVFGGVVGVFLGGFL